MSKIFMTLIGVFLCTSLTQAQSTSQVADTLELEPVIVTASKIPLSARETTKPVLVISREEIERSAGRDIAQVLNAQSGIIINNAFGNPSSNKSVFLQGASAQYTLILIDGIAINDPSGGGGAFDIRQLPLSNVERIEVVKGSQSTLYGTDAIAGVINIITKSNAADTYNVAGTASYGSFNSFQGTLGVSGTLNEVFGYNVQYSRESSDGISEAEDRNNTGGFDDDGFSQDAFLVKFNIKPVKGLTISPFLNYSFIDGEFDADAFTDGTNTFDLSFFNPGSQFTYVQNKLRITGGYQYTRDESNFLGAFGPFRSEGRFHNADVYGTYIVHQNVQVLGGLNYQSNVIPDQASSQIFSPYATVFVRDLNGLNAEIGYRLNSHTEYGNNSTFSFSPSYNITNQVKVLASISTGFKAPTVNELFGPFGANVDLDPQESVSFDIGIETNFLNGAITTEVHYFNRQIDDLILFSFADGFQNVGEQDDQGIEIATNWIINKFVSIGLNYNYLDGEITTPAPLGGSFRRNNLLRRPEHRIGGNIKVNATDDLFFSLQGAFSDERQDNFFDPVTFAASEVTLDSFTIFNFYGEYRVPGGNLTIFTDIKNLFDADYTEVFGFNTIGIAAKGGVRFNIN